MIKRQKIGWITFKHIQTLLRNVHSNAFFSFIDC